MRVGGGLFRIWIGGGWPGVPTEVARRGDRVEAPDLVPILGIQRGHSAADALLRARDAGEDEPVVVAVRAGQAIAVLVVLELGAPLDLAGLLVQGDETAVEQAGVDSPVADSDTPVVPTAADQVIDLRNI